MTAGRLDIRVLSYTAACKKLHGPKRCGCGCGIRKRNIDESTIFTFLVPPKVTSYDIELRAGEKALGMAAVFLPVIRKFVAGAITYDPSPPQHQVGSRNSVFAHMRVYKARVFIKQIRHCSSCVQLFLA